jgi:hypothetical protein
MTCSMFLGNFVETGWKLKKLKHVGALACIFVRRAKAGVDISVTYQQKSENLEFNPHWVLPVV